MIIEVKGYKATNGFIYERKIDAIAAEIEWRVDDLSDGKMSIKQEVAKLMTTYPDAFILLLRQVKEEREKK